LIAALRLLRADRDSPKRQQSCDQKRQTKSKRDFLHEIASARVARSICQTVEGFEGRVEADRSVRLVAGFFL